MADWKVVDIKFHVSMATSPRGQVLSRFGWSGTGFIRGRVFMFFQPVHGFKRINKGGGPKKGSIGPSSEK